MCDHMRHSIGMLMQCVRCGLPTDGPDHCAGCCIDTDDKTEGGPR